MPALVIDAADPGLLIDALRASLIALPGATVNASKDILDAL